MYRFLSRLVTAPKFIFNGSHDYVTKDELAMARSLVGASDTNVTKKFEDAYANLVGDGACVSFASGRMGFYSAMIAMGISKDDEVILLGFTCSVMVNAVIKIGAKPVFSDVDPDTFGSSLNSIVRCISSKTKLIVAQHTFGIPCDIEPIIRFAKEMNIFVIEDCALTLGSKVNGKTVGNFGDAAIFSTDHTKPINTLIGGLIYSNNKEIINKVRRIQNEASEFDENRQKALWKRLMVERHLKSYPTSFLRAVDYLYIFIEKVMGINSPFLLSDYSSCPGHANYPYPAKMPSFLAQIGIFEIKKWPETKDKRTKALQRYIRQLNQAGIESFLPKSYGSSDLCIVPLRICWSMPDGSAVRSYLSKLIDIENTWFTQPIISSETDLEDYGYSWSSCPISEALGSEMINLPCDLSDRSIQQIVKRIEKGVRVKYQAK